MSSTSKRSKPNLDPEPKPPQNPNFSPSKTPKSYDPMPDDVSARRRKRKESAASGEKSSDSKKQARSDADAVAVLRGMIDFRARTGAIPTRAAMDAFYNSIQSSLSTPLTKEKLYNKIRHLRHKFNHSDPDDRGIVYELSAEAWGPSSEQKKPKKKAKISDEMNKETKTSKNGTVYKESVKKEENEEESNGDEDELGIESDSFPFLIHEVTKYWKANGLSVAWLESALKLVKPSKATPLEAKWRKLSIQEMKSQAAWLDMFGSLL
ncbi:uncharacterized protein [Typha angustifolia]|uniref:uncharacterized protein n=1 Tax=Typha angustifolia TaxID=59011 RepID=UPI003C2F865E